MTLLDNHLEQISLSSTAISELPFPPPKIFTNALLRSHDITALIRDTESHERALFTFAPQDKPVVGSSNGAARRNTSYGQSSIARTGVTKSQGGGATVATLLGGKLGEQIRKESAKEAKDRGEVDVNLLLEGAEKLCAVYPIQGANERIASLRSRHGRLTSSIARYESKVAKQMIQLEKMNKNKHGAGECGQDEDEEIGAYETDGEAPQVHRVTEDDLKREDEEIRELESKKRALEDRVSGMERDLGGLLR